MKKTFKRQEKIESLLANLKKITKKTTDKEIEEENMPPVDRMIDILKTKLKTKENIIEEK